MDIKITTKEYALKEFYPDLVTIIQKRFKEFSQIQDEEPFLVRKGFTTSDVKFTDGEKATIDYITTKSLDRDGEIVDPEGIDFTEFEKHRIVPWCHDYKSLPLGKALWIKRDEKGCIAKTQYAIKSNPFAKQVYDFQKDGFPLGKSLGFIPVQWNDYDPKKNKGLKRYYNKSLVLEYSVVPIPNNPDALNIAVGKGLFVPEHSKSFIYMNLNEINLDEIKTEHLPIEKLQDFELKLFNKEEIKTMKIQCPTCNTTMDFDQSKEAQKCPKCGANVNKDGGLAKEAVKKEEVIENVVVKEIPLSEQPSIVKDDVGVCTTITVKESNTEGIVEKVAKREDIDKDDGVKEYGDVEFADEKNKKYPIDNEEHVRAALAYWGMPKNREKYSTEDQKAITDKIKAAAKKLGIEVAKEFDGEIIEKTINEETVVVKQFDLSGNPSVSDITEAVRNFIMGNASAAEAIPISAQATYVYIRDLYPVNYPNGHLIYCYSKGNDKEKYFQVEYTYVPQTGVVTLGTAQELEMGYKKKALYDVAGVPQEITREIEQKVLDLEERLTASLTRVNDYEEEVEDLREIEQKYLEQKEGRVLSGKNKKLVEQCITALQDLLEASVVNKEVKDFQFEDITSDMVQKAIGSISSNVSANIIETAMERVAARLTGRATGRM